MSTQLLYFADPMCSWCWGFSPVIDTVRQRFGDQLPMQLILGGLYPGTKNALDEASKQTIREHWVHVHDASGQPFDFSFFEREDFVYDTEPPSRAIVAVRHSNPELAFPFLKTVHRAFYTENKDVTDREVLCDLAAQAGLSRETFATALDSEEILRETHRDFAIARQAGINGFPTLLVGSDSQGYGIVTHGYQPSEKIEAVIEAWLERTRQEQTIEGV